MKLSPILAATLALIPSSHASSNTTTSAITTSFNTDSDTDLTPEGRSFAENCLRHSFNDIQRDSRMEAAHLVSDVCLPDSRPKRPLGSQRGTSRFREVLIFIPEWNGDFLGEPTFHDTERRALETRFCHCLSRGPFQHLWDAHSCRATINVSTEAFMADRDITEDLITNEIAAMVKDSPTPAVTTEMTASFRTDRSSPLTSLQRSFINDALRDAFNEVYRGRDIQLKQAAVVHSVVVPQALLSASESQRSFEPAVYQDIMTIQVEWGSPTTAYTKGSEMSLDYQRAGSSRRYQYYLHRQYERLFCERLFTSQWNEFNSVLECVITLQNQVTYSSAY